MEPHTGRQPAARTAHHRSPHTTAPQSAARTAHHRTAHHTPPHRSPHRSPHRTARQPALHATEPPQPPHHTLLHAVPHTTALHTTAARTAPRPQGGGRTSPSGRSGRHPVVTAGHSSPSPAGVSDQDAQVGTQMSIQIPALPDPGERLRSHMLHPPLTKFFG